MTSGASHGLLPVSSPGPRLPVTVPGMLGRGKPGHHVHKPLAAQKEQGSRLAPEALLRRRNKKGQEEQQDGRPGLENASETRSGKLATDSQRPR